jgi:hypothetical protein
MSSPSPKTKSFYCPFRKMAIQQKYIIELGDIKREYKTKELEKEMKNKY